MKQQLDTIPSLERTMFFLLAGMVVVSCALKVQAFSILSLTMGGFIAILDFWIIKKGVFYIVHQNPSRFKIALFIVLKFLIFLAILGCVLMFFKDNLWGVIAGISVLVLAVFIEIFKRIFIYGAS